MLSKIQKNITLYFNCTTQESNGLLVLFSLMAILIAFPPLLQWWKGNEPYQLSASDQKFLDSVFANATQVNTDKKFSTGTFNETVAFKLFNPNIANEDELTMAGLPKHLAKRIVKYRRTIQKFSTKKDLKKIYGIDETLYTKLSPYIVLEQQTEIPTKPSNNKVERENYRFDINTADSTTLVRLRGIGPILAARILKYRNKLGGFVSSNQLAEVYGLDSSAQAELRNHSFVSPTFTPTQQFINQSDKNTLASHPYIGWQLAKLIIAYREQHGPFQNLEELLAIPLITRAKLEQMKPYIKL